MEANAVIKFLGFVPLLQDLPISAHIKIAKVVKFAHYEIGDYVVHQCQKGGEIFFIFEGEAEVIGSMIIDEEIRSEFQLKKYDYFGHGFDEFGYQVSVIASTTLKCLILPHDNWDLLREKPISSLNKSSEAVPLIEHILHLDQLEVNVFQGITLSNARQSNNVFGGQLIAQALCAATKTVDCLKVINSLHACFLLSGDVNLPIMYFVHHLRDGNNFSNRRVDAFQKGNIIFTLLTSFQKEEIGFDHQEAIIPIVPPHTLLSSEELWDERLIDARLPRSYRNQAARKRFIPWPVDIKHCERRPYTSQDKTPPILNYWFRARGKLSDDQALHRCIVSYTSDYLFLPVSLNPHRGKGLKTYSTSLDHSMWFHRSFRADEWILFSMVSPSACNGRGFCSGQMFNMAGELLVSVAQEGLIRKLREPQSAPSKL